MAGRKNNKCRDAKETREKHKNTFYLRLQRCRQLFYESTSVSQRNNDALQSQSCGDMLDDD